MTRTFFVSFHSRVNRNNSRKDDVYLFSDKEGNILKADANRPFLCFISRCGLKSPDLGLFCFLFLDKIREPFGKLEKYREKFYL